MFIVSGYRRSGTTAMMWALVKALKTPNVLAYQSSDESIGNVEHDGYIPNPKRLLEVGGYARAASFLRQLPDNALIKLFYDSVINVPAGDHVVIFMDRDAEVIRESIRRVYDHHKKIGYKHASKGWHECVRTFDVHRPYCEEEIEQVIGILEQRKDINLIRVNYGDLIADPTGEFQRIKDAGLDINVRKAASVIDSKYYRSRASEFNSEEQPQRASSVR